MLALLPLTNFTFVMRVVHTTFDRLVDEMINWRTYTNPDLSDSDLFGISVAVWCTWNKQDIVIQPIIDAVHIRSVTKFEQCYLNEFRNFESHLLRCESNETSMNAMYQWLCTVIPESKTIKTDEYGDRFVYRGRRTYVRRCRNSSPNGSIRSPYELSD